MAQQFIIIPNIPVKVASVANIPNAPKLLPNANFTLGQGEHTRLFT